MDKLFNHLHLYFLLFTLLPVCLPTLVQAQAPVESGDEQLRPEVVIPFMKTAPKIDGVIRPGEWPTLHISRLVNGRGCCSRGRRSSGWAATGRRFISPCNPPCIRLPGCWDTRSRNAISRMPGGWPGASSAIIGGEDYLDVLIDNNPGRKNRHLLSHLRPTPIRRSMMRHTTTG